jgi:poly-gamma-glutamate system protein
MQGLYWRSNRVSTPQLAVVAVLAAFGLAMIERNPVEEPSELHDEMLAAAQLTERAFRAIYLERISQQIPLDPELDPAGSGLIGAPHTLIVSNEGHLEAKQTTANPNFAAVFVDMLHQAGVEEGDLLAANFTGSFPAMDIAMACAFEVMGVQPLVVSSVASSEYGATHPTLTWPDMERVLFERDLISFRSRVLTMGGIGDVARGHSEEGRAAILAAIERNALPLMQPGDYDEAVTMRMDLYDRLSGDRPIAAYVNIGGGTASVGTSRDKRDYAPGLNTSLPLGLERPSVMRRFLERDVPVIHVSHIRDIARAYGLPEAPVEVPLAGEGRVFLRRTVPTWAILLVLGLILGALFLATRFDLGSTFFKKGEGKGGPPEQMV